MLRNAGNVFPCRWLERKPLVSDPDMHHGTSVTHVPWWMTGSLTRGGGENVPDIPDACTTCTYLARGPLETALLCNDVSHCLDASLESALIYFYPIVSHFQNLLVSRIWASHGSGWLETTLTLRVNGVGLLPVRWCQLMAGTADNPTIGTENSTACHTTMANLAGEMTTVTRENRFYASYRALYELVSKG